MTPFRVTSLDHVSITAPEELEADVLAWYQNVLGLTPLEMPEGTLERGGWFLAGEQTVQVSIDPHNPPDKAHFALAVDDLAAAVEQLRAAGCHIEQAAPIPGRHSFFTRDPAGNRVELIGYDV